MISKQEYFDAFFAKYSLNEEENCVLIGSNLFSQQKQTQSISDPFFFKAFKRLLEIIKNVEEELKINSENLALLQLSGQLQEKLSTAYDTLYLATTRNFFHNILSIF